MEKRFLFFSICVVFLIALSSASAQLTLVDRTKIQNQLTLVANAVNNDRIDAILNIVSKNARSGLKGEIINELKGQKITFEQTITSFEDLGNNQARVKGVFDSHGATWNVTNRDDYFLFEKYGNSWLLLDTDFHQKITGKSSPQEITDRVTEWLKILVPIIFILEAFWILMIIDATRRQFDSKLLWIILIIVFNFLSAIIYYFFIRPKLKNLEDMSGIIYSSQTMNPQSTQKPQTPVQYLYGQRPMQPQQPVQRPPQSVPPPQQGPSQYPPPRNS